MGRPSFPFVLLISFLCVCLSKAESSSSAIAFHLCDDVVQGIPFEIEVKGDFSEIPDSDSRSTLADSNSGYSNKIWNLRFLTGAAEKTSRFEGHRVYKNNVNHIKVNSQNEICFQALVVDAIIFVDQNTSFRESCVGRERDLPPCKELNSEIQPLPVCPEQLTKLLKDKNLTSTVPAVKPGGRDFKVPEYNTVMDMGDASSAIVGGLVDLGRKVLKRVSKNYKDALKTSINALGGVTLGTLTNFMKAIGPVASVFGGILSIVTSYLTPNPWNEMVKYLEKEFDEVHRRLTHIQSDIADLKRVVQYENKVCGIGRKLEAIRYSLRRYEEMVQGLSNNKVCGQSNFLNRSEVKDFMKQYEDQYVGDSLLDLYGVEFGEVLEASSLLKPLMRAYCLTDPNKVQRFMEDISVYGSAGLLVHSGFLDLKCRADGAQNCEDGIITRKKEKMATKAYAFLTKAEALKQAASDPLGGLKFDIKDDLNTTIRNAFSEYYYPTKVEYYETSNVIINKVDQFITNKIADINDWPEACLVNQGGKTIIVYVGQFHNLQESLPHPLWGLPSHVEIDKSKLHVYTKAGQRGFAQNLYNGDPGFENCDGIQCDVTKSVSSGSRADLVFILYNAKDYHIQFYPEDFPANTKKSSHPELIVTKYRVYVLYVENRWIQENTSLNEKVILGTRTYRPGVFAYYAFVEI